MSGAAGGVTGQVTANAISGQSLDTGLWQAALAGGVLGGLAGGYAGYKGSSSAGANASAEQGGSRPWPWLFRSLRGVQPQIRRFIGPATAEQAAGRDITVFSGHGSLRKVGAFFAPRFTVPEGTTLSVYSRPGYTISNSFGNAIETNTTSAISNARTRYFGGLIEGPAERITYGPGASVPNYTLHPPHDLDVVQIPGGPTVQTVTSSTYLSELLKPNMGEVSWAACTSYERLFLPHFIPRRGSVILLN